MTRVVWILCFAISLCPLSAQIGSKPLEGLRENTPRVHVLRGATVVPAPGRSIANGTVVLRDGLIEAVGGAEIAVPADARVWDVAGMTIYPGFIESWLEVEVADGEGKRARHWNPRVRPERFAANALAALSDDRVKALRGLGFTTAQLLPKAGLFRGSSCLISLRDGSSRDRLMATQVSQCASFDYGGGGYPGSLMGSIALMRQALLDARWQRDSLVAYSKDPKGIERVEANESLAALQAVVDGKRRVLFRAGDELAYARFMKVAEEFELQVGFLGNGHEYRVADTIKKAGAPLVLPLAFPATPAVEDPDAALGVSLEELEHWEFAPSNAAFLEKAEIPFSLTTAELADAKGKFFKHLRSSVERGLSKDAALAALTAEPAKLVGAFDQLGSIAEGKIANLVIADGDLFESGKAKVHSVWIDGIPIEQEAAREVDLAGAWKVTIAGDDEVQEWRISGSEKSLKIKFGEESFPAKVTDGRLLLAFPSAKAIGREADGVARLTAVVTDPRRLDGAGTFPGGESFVWSGEWSGELAEEPKGDVEEDEEPEKGAVPELVFDRYPAGAFGISSPRERPEVLLVRGATVWTCAEAGIIEEGDVLVEGGKISAVGKGLEAPQGARIIEAGGRHVTPGLIDCHSHVAISGGVNEGTDSVTMEVRIGDVVDPTDIGIYRQLAGGLTTSNLLHGSANPMGGQNQVIKLRWGSRDAQALAFAGAKPGVKFALGENVKQSNWGDKNTTRYPQTRMGVQQIMRDTFMAAQDYRRAGRSRRDLRLDAALEILDGERIVHIHSYRQDEILMFVRLAEEFGFTVGTFQHVLEGYKVADAIAKLGAGGSTFSDWWAYKIEVYDAIPFNGALMREVGILTSFNSDDAELATRMNLEAAKAVKYGGVPEAEALKFVTLNPAKQLRIDQWVGSLEPGKDADFVIWSKHPMSARAVAQQTWIDGALYFDLVSDAAEIGRINAERERLIAKALSARVSALAKGDENKGAADDTEGDDKVDGAEDKPGLRFLLPNAAAGDCRSIYRGLYHNGRSLHTCSRNGCCNN